MTQASSSPAGIPAAVRFDGRILFCPQDPQDRRERHLNGEDVTLAAGLARCATTSRPTRSRRCRSCYALRRQARPLSVHRPQRAAARADRRRARPGRRLRGDRGAASATARARRASTARRPSGSPASASSSPRASSASIARTPTTSACSPRPTSAWSTRIAARRGDPDRRAARGPRRAGRGILRSGGLLRFGQRAHARLCARRRARRAARAAHAVREDRRAPRARDRAHAAASAPGEGAFVRADWRFIHEYYTGMCAHLLRRDLRRSRWRCTSRRRIVAFEDHTSYVDREPGARARRPGAQRARAMAAGAARVRRAATAAHAPHADRRRGRRRRRQQRRRHLARDDGRALRAARASWSSAPTRTRRTAARSAASPSASARPTWPTPSSPARCA